MRLTKKDEETAFRTYLFLSAIFITSLVVSNLIFQKFFAWYPLDFDIFGIRIFELSVGILPYPITFLVTDIVSEIYGRKKANYVVLMGVLASFFSLIIVFVANKLPAVEFSPVNNATFDLVFSNSKLAIVASMIAYLIAQYIDIKIFHFIKLKMKGRHLWIRNNFSTFTSMFLDTFIVIFLLSSFQILKWEYFAGLLISGVMFKVLIAVLDTPFIYISVYALRKKFNIKPNEELKLSF